MRNTIIILTFIMCAISFVSAQYERLSHYNIYTDYLKIEHLDNQSFVAYGGNGNVLKTDNTFQSWTQEFSGIHNDILKVSQYEDILYGITRNGEFIKSTDKGNWWTSEAISEDMFNDFYIDNGTFYISKLTDSVLYSNDQGNTWQSIYVAEDTLRAIHSIDNQIIVNKNYRELLIFKDNKWESFPLPNIALGFPSVNIRSKGEKLFLFVGSDLAILNESLEWTEYDLNEPGIRDVIETETELICFAFNSYTNTLSVAYCDKFTQLLNKREIIKDYNLHELYHLVQYAAKDGKGNIFATGAGKTIFTKQNNETEWETVTSFMIPLVDNLTAQYIEDKNNWGFSTSDRNFIKTDDGGVSFQQGEYFANDTISLTEIFPRYFKKVDYISLDTIHIQFTTGDSSAISIDGGMTFDKYIDSSSLKLLTKHADYDDFSIYYRGYTQFDDYVLFFRVEDSTIVDTIFRMDDRYPINITDYDGKLLILAEDKDNQEYEIYLTDTKFDNSKEVFSFNYNVNNKPASTFRIDKYFVEDINSIYIIVRENLWDLGYAVNRYFRINGFNKEPKISFLGPVFYNYGVLLDDERLISIGIQDTNTLELEYYLGRYKLDENGFDYEILGETGKRVLKA